MKTHPIKIGLHGIYIIQIVSTNFTIETNGFGFCWLDRLSTRSWLLFYKTLKKKMDDMRKVIMNMDIPTSLLRTILRNVWQIAFCWLLERRVKNIQSYLDWIYNWRQNWTHMIHLSYFQNPLSTYLYILNYWLLDYKTTTL